MTALIDKFLIAGLTVGFYVGWNIGSNDAANAMGAGVGGRVLGFRRAISIIVIFVVMGAVLEGGKVMETVGKDIVTGSISSPLTQLPVVAIIALLAAGVWVTTATTLGLPISTSQSVVGSVVGAGLLISILEPSGIAANVQFGIIGRIGIAWVLSPMGAAIFAYILYHGSAPLLRKIKSARVLNRVLEILVIGAGGFVAYTLGTNDVGTAMGLVSTITQAPIFSIRLIALFGAIALAFGAITYSRRVIRTVGTGITRLDPMTAFMAQFGAAFMVWTFNQFGIPVSTTQAIVGGVAGAGLVKGTAAVSKGKLKEIGVAWVLTPTVAAGLTFILGFLALSLMGV